MRSPLFGSLLLAAFLCTVLMPALARADALFVVDIPRWIDESNAGKEAKARIEEKRKSGTRGESLKEAELAEVKKLLSTLDNALTKWAKAQKVGVVIGRGDFGVLHAAPALELTDALVLASDNGTLDRFEVPEAKRPVRVALVDYNRVLQESREGKARKAKLQEQFRKAQEELAAREKALFDLRIGVQLNTFGADPVELRAKLEKEERAVRELLHERQAGLALEEELALHALQKLILPLLEAQAQQDGLTLVLNANDVEVLHADGRLDITDELVKVVDAGAVPPKPKLVRPRPETKLGFVDLKVAEEAMVKRSGPLKDEADKKKVMDTLRKAAAQVAGKEGFHLVLGRAGGTAVFIRPDLDLTAKVAALVAPEASKVP